MTARALLIVTVTLMGLLCSCDRRPKDCPELQKRYADVVAAAVELVEEHVPFSIAEPSVAAFRDKYPCVIGLLLAVDKQNRIRLTPDDSVREELDERVRPVSGVLYYDDGSTQKFIEFRRKCKYNESTVTLLVRIDEAKGEPDAGDGR